ncbi:hypothetical protein F5Y12DRAFT_727323 [Xylaria sp. FL1777]|nr:hypothetical protein F5Y12DRAFT_727323 [Xylaria sp. FL1777]
MRARTLSCTLIRISTRVSGLQGPFTLFYADDNKFLVRPLWVMLCPEGVPGCGIPLSIPQTRGGWPKTMARLRWTKFLSINSRRRR